MAHQVIRETRVNLKLDDVTLEGHLAIPEEPRESSYSLMGVAVAGTVHAIG